MSLKQIKHEDRIIFLRRFTTELINSLREQKPSKQIEIEKLKQKFFQPLDSQKTFEKSISASFFQKPVYSKGIKPVFIKPKFEPKFEPKITEKRKPILHRLKILKKPTQHLQKQVVKPVQQVQKQKPKISPTQRVAEIKPEPQERPEGFTLGELELFLKDPSIQSLESPGPGRNILVKKYNRVNVTRMVLSQREITELINKFSEKARIPIVGGILKAAVGDLVISAVISEFVGSRFIINKMTPYSLIEKK
jgi:hypothetical protein